LPIVAAITTRKSGGRCGKAPVSATSAGISASYSAEGPSYLMATALLSIFALMAIRRRAVYSAD
jgi:hypothetical protein